MERRAGIVICLLVFLALIQGCGSSTLTVEGTFILFDTFTFTRPGGSCDGEGGYADISALTPGRVETINGDVLARTALGEGSLASAGRLAALMTNEDEVYTEEQIQQLLDFAEVKPCLFQFSFEVRSGSDEGKGYVVKVGDRGELFLSEEELQEPGAIQLSLGGEP
jgi:hypothetical protein